MCVRGSLLPVDNPSVCTQTLPILTQVEDVMRDFELKFASPNQPLTQVQPLLDSVTGLPVVDDSLVVVGVLSRKVPVWLLLMLQDFAGGFVRVCDVSHDASPSRMWSVHSSRDCTRMPLCSSLCPPHPSLYMHVRM